MRFFTKKVYESHAEAEDARNRENTELIARLSTLTGLLEEQTNQLENVVERLQGAVKHDGTK